MPDNRETCRTFNRGIGRWLPLAALMLVCGCADDRPPAYPAGGTVTQSNGKPLPGGWIEFQLAGDAMARTAKAEIQPDGRFELGTFAEADGAMEGKYRVIVMPPVPPFRDPRAQPGPPPDRSRYPKIHPRYRKFESSDLTFSVTPEATQNRFEIRLED